MSNILVISSKDRTHKQLETLLTNAGYVYLGILNLDSLAHLSAQFQPDIIVFDVSNHDDEALLCQDLRSSPLAADKPLLVLTHRIDASQAATLLDAGADDLLRRPFEDREFLARIRALLRYAMRPAHNRAAQLRLVEQQNTVYIDQRCISLTPIEFQLLSFLCHNRDRYYTADELLSTLWKYPPKTGDTALVRNHIRNLRRKLELDPDHPQVLVSRYGQGYTIHAVVEAPTT